jgi:CheY-like chemotaxis protein
MALSPPPYSLTRKEAQAMDRPRVLVVDPDAESQVLIRRVLGRHCDLVFQNDPLHLFDALEVFEPDLIILELELPRLSGFELINLIQGEPAFKSIPIMVFSVRHELEDQKLAYRLGASHFQAKPARPSQLFKGAAMFVRLMSRPRLPKQCPMEEVPRRLVERQAQHRIHPLLDQVMNVQKHQYEVGRPGERSILASIAGRRSAA